MNPRGHHNPGHQRTCLCIFGPPKVSRIARGVVRPGGFVERLESRGPIVNSGKLLSSVGGSDRLAPDAVEGKMRSVATRPVLSGASVGLYHEVHPAGGICRGGSGHRYCVSKYSEGARSLKGVTKMWTVVDAWKKGVLMSFLRNGKSFLAVLALASLFVMGLSNSATAQCGSGSPPDFNGNCVKFEWRPAQQTVFVGETVEMGLYVVSINTIGQPVQAVSVVFEWDEAMLELLGNRVCLGGSNDGQVCLSRSDCFNEPCVDTCVAEKICSGGLNDGQACRTVLDCSGEPCVFKYGPPDWPDLPCFSCPEDIPPGRPAGYEWASTGFPNDFRLDGLNADCGPSTFCPSYTGKPFNDGEAYFTASKQFACDGAPAPAPLATQSGLEVTRIRFRATAPGTAQVTMIDDGASCAEYQKICLGGSPQTANQPCDVESDCLGDRTCLEPGNPGPIVCTSDADCSPGIKCGVHCKACSPEQCCTSDLACTICAFAQTRVIGGANVGIDVTAPPSTNNPAIVNISPCSAPDAKSVGPRYIEVTPQSGPATVAIGIRGVGPTTSCVTGYLTATGTIGSSPLYQSPAAWGTILGRDADLIADGDYEIWADCVEASPGFSESDAVSVTTWKWADANNSNVVDVLDFVRVIDGFRGDLLLSTPCASDAECVSEGPNYKCNTGAGFCIYIEISNVDLVPALGCQPDHIVDILDIVRHVDEFRGAPIPCPGPCVP